MKTSNKVSLRTVKHDFFKHKCGLFPVSMAKHSITYHDPQLHFYKPGMAVHHVISLSWASRKYYFWSLFVCFFCTFNSVEISICEWYSFTVIVQNNNCSGGSELSTPLKRLTNVKKNHQIFLPLYNMWFCLHLSMTLLEMLLRYWYKGN